MTTASDSRFFVNDCSCIKKEVNSNIFIECNACIEGFNNNIHYNQTCSCKYYTIKQLNCPTCSIDRDHLDDLHTDFDKLLLELSSAVKSYVSCEYYINTIVEISKEMRLCNNRLLSRIVDNQDHTDYNNTNTNINTMMYYEEETSSENSDI